MRVAKTKVLISFAVTAKLICAFFSPRQTVGFPMWILNDKKSYQQILQTHQQ